MGFGDFLKNMFDPTAFIRFGGKEGISTDSGDEMMKPENLALIAMRPDLSSNIMSVETMRQLTGRAEGGPIDPNVPYIVGEKGPEIIVPNQSGTVIPNPESPGYFNTKVAKLLQDVPLGKLLYGPKLATEQLLNGGLPTPESPATVSPTVDPANVDQQKFRDWHKFGVANFGLHPDVGHPDNNVNLHDIFAKGGQFVATPQGQPDVIRTTDGKDTKISPNAFAMTQTPEQVSQQRQGTPSPTTQPQAPPSAGQLLSGTSATPQQIQTPVAPTLAPAPVMPAPSSGPVGMPQTGAQLLSQILNPKADDLTGKIMTAAGMLATAVDSKRFGPVGQMLTQLGEKEVARGRGNAAARLAGFPSVEALEAAKTEAGIRKTLSDTGLDKTKALYYDVLHKHGLAEIPGITAEGMRKVIQAESEQFKLGKERQVGLSTIRTPSGNTYTMEPVQAAQLEAHFESVNIQRQNMLSSTNLNEQQRLKVIQDIERNKPMIPMTVGIPGGGTQTVNMTREEYLKNKQIDMSATNKEDVRRARYSETVIKPIQEYIKTNAMIPNLKLPPNMINAGESAAMDMLKSSDPIIRDEGKYLMLLIGKQVPAVQPSAGNALRGSITPVAPTSPAWGGR